MSALEKALGSSRVLEIDECEVVKLRKNTITVRITDSKIAEIKQNFDQSYGVRIIHGNRIASIKTTNQDDIPDALSRSVRNLKVIEKRDF